MLNQEFINQVACLSSPRMGTETMAPLLYQLIRFTRPTKVLEIGMGYTTPFLAKALADNYAEDIAAIGSLKAKASILSADVGAEGEGFDRRAFAKLEKAERLAWLEATPSLADPTFYDNRPTPLLIAVDDLSSEHTSARVQQQIISELGLDTYVKVVDGTFRGQAKNVLEKYGEFDFMWFDCGGHQEYEDFLDEYWPILNGNGGLLLMHYTLTNLSMGSVIKDFKLSQFRHPADAELVSLLEPHKMMQNSFSLIRKTSNFKDKIYYEVRDLSLEKD